MPQRFSPYDQQVHDPADRQRSFSIAHSRGTRLGKICCHGNRCTGVLQREGVDPGGVCVPFCGVQPAMRDAAADHLFGGGTALLSASVAAGDRSPGGFSQLLPP